MLNECHLPAGNFLWSPGGHYPIRKSTTPQHAPLHLPPLSTLMIVMIEANTIMALFLSSPLLKYLICISCVNIFWLLGAVEKFSAPATLAVMTPSCGFQVMQTACQARSCPHYPSRPCCRLGFRVH